MKFLLPAAAALLAAAPAAHAEGWNLMTDVPQCAAIEALIVWGLIDGGPDGDTTEISALIGAGDAGLCQARLEGYGYPGLADPTCAEAFSLLAAQGLPEWLAGEEQVFLTDILSPAYDTACADMVFDLTAGQ